MAAKFYLKPFSDRSYDITLSRKAVGRVVKNAEGKWDAVMFEHKVTVKNFHSAANAFHNVVLAHNIASLKARLPNLNMRTPTEGRDTNTAEVLAYNDMLRDYVGVYNFNTTHSQMRVVQRRR